MDRKKRLLGKLPPLDRLLRGSLLKRYRTCGKPNCRCATGEPHGPNYYLSLRRRDGTTVTVPVPPDLRKSVRKYIANYRRTRDILDQVIHVNVELLRKRRLQ